MMPNELILMEDSVKEIPERNVRGRREGFRMDYRFDNGIGSARRLDNQPYENGFIRRIFNAKSDTIRATCQSSPLKGELEIEEFTRDFLEEKAPSMWSLPLVCFRDGFGVYRNMYRSLTGLYMSIAGMDQRQRSRRVNNFALTLGPHGSDTGVVLRSIKAIKTLDKGIEVTVKGEKRWLCAHIHVYTGDMTQQNLDAGILAPSATYSCRHCLIPKAKRSDLDFDIIAEGRYHHHMKEYREYYGSTMASSNFGKMCSKVGLKVGDSALTDITKAIDMIEDFPMDPAHLHFFGLGKRSQTLLITAVFTPAAQKEYVRELQRFPFPPGWNRLQSPLHHLKSWSLQECARGMVITPMLLRDWLRAGHLKDEYLKAAGSVFKEEIRRTGIDETNGTAMDQAAVEEIIHCYALLANGALVLMSSFIPLDKRGSFHSIVLEAIQAF
jgi:hypothetical protein